MFYACVSETIVVESSNKALEHCGYGPKPSDGIRRLTDKIVAHTKVTHRKRQSEAHQFLNKRYSEKDNSPKRKTQDESPKHTSNTDTKSAKPSSNNEADKSICMNALSTDIMFQKKLYCNIRIQLEQKLQSLHSSGWEVEAKQCNIGRQWWTSYISHHLCQIRADLRRTI